MNSGESRRRPQRDDFAMALWSRICCGIGFVIVVGYFVFLLANGYGKLEPPPRQAVLVMLGGFALIGVSLLPVFLRLRRMWRRIDRGTGSGPPPRP